MPLKIEKSLKSSKNEHVWARNFLIPASIFLKFCMHVELIMPVFLYSYIDYLCPTDFTPHTTKIEIWQKSHKKGNNSYKYFWIFLKFCMHLEFNILVIFAFLQLLFIVNSFHDKCLWKWKNHWNYQKMSMFWPVTFLYQLQSSWNFACM